MLSIRPLVPSDDDRVLRLNAAAQPHVALLDGAELARLRALSNSHIVAVRRDVILGYALTFSRDDTYDGEEFLRLRSLIPEPFSYVDEVVVAEPARGSGIGRALYQFIERAASAGGARCLCCEVNTEPPNPGSLAFHARMGFDAIGSLATQDGRNVSLLRKPLPA